MTASRDARAERYGGSITAVGGSTGIIWLDVDFFMAHPEFNGEVHATVIGEGQILLSAGAARRGEPEDGGDRDPMMPALLSFLERQAAEHPELIEPADRARLAWIGKLVKGADAE